MAAGGAGRFLRIWVGQNMLVVPALGTPAEQRNHTGIDNLAPADSAATPEVKKVFVGGVLTHNNDGNDQPDPISRLHIGATFYTEGEDADDFIHPIYRKGALYDDDTDEES